MRFVGQYEGCSRSCFRDQSTRSLAVVRGVGKTLSAATWTTDQCGGVASMVNLLIQDGLVKHVPAALSFSAPNLFDSPNFDQIPDQRSARTAITVTANETKRSDGTASNNDNDLSVPLSMTGGCFTSTPIFSSCDGGSIKIHPSLPQTLPSTQSDQFNPVCSHTDSAQDLLNAFECTAPLSNLPLSHNHERGLQRNQLNAASQRQLHNDQTSTPTLPSGTSLHSHQPPPPKINDTEVGKRNCLNVSHSDVSAAAAAAAAFAAAAVFRAAGFAPNGMPELQQAQTNSAIQWHEPDAGSGSGSNGARPTSTSQVPLPEFSASQESTAYINAEMQNAKERERKAFERKLRNRVAALRANKLRSEKYKKLVRDVGRRRDVLLAMRERVASLQAENARLRKVANLPTPSAHTNGSTG
jgi:hypothetical protein